MSKRFWILVVFAGLILFVPQAFARVVPCPGDDSDSSALIQNALNEATPGEIIQLEAGTYFLYRPVQVNTAFKGTLLGAGMDRTILTIHPGHPIERFNMGSWSDAAVLFWFNIPSGETGDISVMDLSLVVTQANPCAADSGGGMDLWEFIVVNGENVNTRFERLRLKGGPGQSWGEYNSNAGFYIFGPTDPMVFMKGNHLLKDCEFETMPSGYVPWLIRDGKFTLSGNKFNDIRFGFDLEAVSNCTGEITRNQINVHGDGVNWGSGGGIWIWAGTWVPNPDWNYVYAPLPSKFSITRNEVEAVQWGNGIAISDGADETGLIPMRLLSGASISQNKVTGKMTWVGIGTDYAQDFSVTNNEVDGDGAWGIANFEVGTNWLIKGNNVQHFSTIYNPWLPTAPIFLSDWTSGCTVVGGGVKENVTDFGTGNILVGVNNMGGNPPGPAIRTCMKDRVNFKKSFRRP